MTTSIRSKRIHSLKIALIGMLSSALAWGTLAAPPAAAVTTPGVGVKVPVSIGTVEIESVSPAKATYEVGDVVSLAFRMESNADAPERRIVATSEELANASSCDWTLLGGVFPAGAGGKYSCPLPGKPAITYTVTAEDAAAGKAEFRMTWIQTPTDGSAQIISHLDGSIPVSPAGGPTGSWAPADGLAAGLELRDLANRGEGGWLRSRIPALTVAANGDLLAFYDGRPSMADLPSNITMLMRRSTDGGDTWGPQTVVRQEPAPNGFGDPSVIVDRETNKIFLFYAASINRGFGNSTTGADHDDPNVLHADYSVSDDHGATWSHHRITSSIKAGQTNWGGMFSVARQT